MNEMSIQIKKIKMSVDLILLSTLGALIVISISGWLLLNSLDQKPPSPQILNQLSESDIRVGDNIDRLNQISNKLISEEVVNNLLIREYESLKNKNVLVTFLIYQNTVIEISYPIVLDEKASIDEIQQPSTNFNEFWNNENVNNKVRIFPEVGFAISYHLETRLANKMYQFYPNDYESFLNRHPEFTEEYVEPFTPDAWTSDMFVTEAEIEAETPQP